MLKEDISSSKVRYTFDNILEFADYANSVPDRNSSKSDGDNKFAGGSFQDAMDQAASGNPELVKKIFEGVNVIRAMIEDDEIGEIRDVTGEYFDVADFLSGEPEVFRREEYGDSRPVVPVYASFSMKCGISTSSIENRGCAIVALCDELAHSGFIVDLHCVQVVEYGKKYYTKIKLCTDPLDIDTMAFIVANPLCLRRLWFAALENYTGRSSCGGYGFPCEYDLDDIFTSGVSGFYFTSSNHSAFSESNYSSLEKAKKHIIGMVERFKANPCQVILG
ncbi:MAG: hypothetical protein AB7F40_04560 [Victivallaceae bacterium]